LHKAFKGELVPQLESDGDAKELLMEIEELNKGVSSIKKAKKTVKNK
jgi:type I restriction enzyme S subunit